MSRRIQLVLIIVLYLGICLTTLFNWYKGNWNKVTGDEPHYLIMTNAISKYHTFEQTKAYSDAFQLNNIINFGLSGDKAIPSPENTHAVSGPNGLYNVHSIGLPILLFIPYLSGKVIIVKIFLIILSSFLVLFTWLFSSKFNSNIIFNSITTIAICFCYPFITSSNQIYPDLVAGIISLGLLYLLFCLKNYRSVFYLLISAFFIAFLPWLQIKNLAVSLILLFSYCIEVYKQKYIKHKQLRIAVYVFFFMISVAFLMFYNLYAFGKIAGPYNESLKSIEISSHALMVFLGLHLDQNQGLFIQHPLLIFSFLYLPLFFKKHFRFALTTFLVYASFISLNALHPNWYGGGSFSGRFTWSSAVILIIPTLFSLSLMFKKYKKITFSVILLTLLFQGYLYYRYSFELVSLYQRNSSSWIEAYSIFFEDIAGYLPAFYQIDWAFKYPVNYLSIILLIIFSGYFYFEYNKKLTFLLSCLISIILFSMFLSNKVAVPHPPIAWAAFGLPSQTGKIKSSERYALSLNDKQGFITYGPYIPLAKGRYQVTVNYSSPANRTEEIGYFDIYNYINEATISKSQILGSSGLENSVSIIFEIDQNNYPNNLQFRTYWKGLSDIYVNKIELHKLTS